MMRRLQKPCLGKLLLVASLGIGAFFSHWIISDSPDEKVHQIFVQHDKLLLQGKRKEAHALFANALSAEGKGPLNPIWLPFVRAQGNGYVQLEYYVRILAGDPNRRATYAEISGLIENAPETFHTQIKPTYLADIAAVAGVRQELLQEYGLLLQDNQSSGGNDR
jgi:hypothetical protein